MVVRVESGIEPSPTATRSERAEPRKALASSGIPLFVLTSPSNIPISVHRISPSLFLTSPSCLAGLP